MQQHSPSSGDKEITAIGRSVAELLQNRAVRELSIDSKSFFPGAFSWILIGQFLALHHGFGIVHGDLTPEHLFVDAPRAHGGIIDLEVVPVTIEPANMLPDIAYPIEFFPADGFAAFLFGYIARAYTAIEPECPDFIDRLLALLRVELRSDVLLIGSSFEALGWPSISRLQLGEGGTYRFDSSDSDQDDVNAYRSLTAHILHAFGVLLAIPDSCTRDLPLGLDGLFAELIAGRPPSDAPKVEQNRFVRCFNAYCGQADGPAQGAHERLAVAFLLAANCCDLEPLIDKGISQDLFQLSEIVFQDIEITNDNHKDIVALRIALSRLKPSLSWYALQPDLSQGAISSMSAKASEAVTEAGVFRRVASVAEPFNSVCWSFFFHGRDMYKRLITNIGFNVEMHERLGEENWRFMALHIMRSFANLMAGVSLEGIRDTVMLLERLKADNDKQATGRTIWSETMFLVQAVKLLEEEAFAVSDYQYVCSVLGFSDPSGKVQPEGASR